MSREDLITTLIGAIIGIVISWIFYRLQKRRKELSWSIENINLIRGYSSLFDNKLEIRYAGNEIENLTISRITLWNSGNETIDKQDVAIPLFMAPAEDLTVLDVEILKASTIGNRFEVKRLTGSDALVVSFDYVDPNQGAVIQIIHTGTTVLPFQVYGEVKGVKEIGFKWKGADRERLMHIVLLIFAIFSSIPAFLDIYQRFFVGNLSPYAPPIWLSIATSFLVIALVIFEIQIFRKTARIPKDLSVLGKDRFLEFPRA